MLKLLLLLIFALPLDPPQLIMGKQDLAQGHYQEAIIHLEQVDDVRARYYEGVSHIRLNNCVSALDNLQEFVQDYTGYGAASWKIEAQKWMDQCAGTQLAQRDNVNEKGDPARQHITNTKKGDVHEKSLVESTEIRTEDSDDDTVKGPDDFATEDADDETITSQDDRHHYKILFAASADDRLEFISLSDLGPVTSEKDEIGMSFYYLGNFDVREHALTAAKKVRSKGFSDATVIEFDKGKMIKEVEVPNIGQLPKEVVSKEEIIPAIQEVKKKDAITYHILFRALDNPYEDFPELEKLGPLFRETFDRKGNSRYLIGSETSIKRAKKLLKKVKKAGYLSSIIVEYLNGDMVGAVD